jgi:hypothetical protein
MKIVGDLDTMRIEGPSLRPFTPRDLTTCPACGISVSGWWRRTLRKLRGKKDEHIVTMRYCPGDKPPSEKCESLAFLMFGPREVIHGCSGIPTPHLHCTCTVCHADWYTALKEAA